jgi:hypothetical protein
VGVTKDQILAGMVAGLASLVPAEGQAITAAKYVRVVARYGGKLDPGSQIATMSISDETLQRGVAGRTPAVLIGFDGERRVRTVISRRRDYVEGTYMAVCCRDSERSRDDRKGVMAVSEDVRRLLGARKLGLAIQPLRYAGTRTVRDDEKLLAIAAVFTTRYWVDYTIEPGADVVESAAGEIVAPAEDEVDGRVLLEADVELEETA